MRGDKVNIKNIIPGFRYHFVGDIQNGIFVIHEEVTRKISYITAKHIVLECGREFIINDNLVITEAL